MKKTAHAKLNITLEIKGPRPDGYHELDMIFLEIGIGDEITAKKAEAGIWLTCSDQTLPTDERNLAYRAAKLMMDRYGIKEGVRLQIEKNIPAQAGLGGGSSDAACVLNIMNELFDLRVQKKELEKLAEELGSDVPFFVRGGCQRAKGRGEILSDIGTFPHCSIVVVKPDVSVSTPWAYKAFDAEKANAAKTEDSGPRAGASDLAGQAIRNGDLLWLGRVMTNDLESPVILEYPVIGKIKELLTDSCAAASMMTGSGSAVFGLFETEEKAAGAMAAVKDAFDVQAFLTQSTVSYLG